jgi:hypothetical protein
VLARILGSAPTLGATGVVLTHTDGALGVGEALSACWDASLPIVWIGTGGTLPDGLEAATGQLLATLALAHVPDVAPHVVPETTPQPPTPAASTERADARAPRRTIAIV